MNDKSLQTDLQYYGISPWEIEVLYGILNDKFTVVQEETGDPLVGNLPMNHVEDDPNFVSVIIITIPVQFSEEFFKWFEFKKWEKIKSIIKEMKRRRGSGNAILVVIILKTDNGITRHPMTKTQSYILTMKDYQIIHTLNLQLIRVRIIFFNNATEKIDNHC